MTLRDLMSVTKALADENRVRMLLALGRGELCVCQITELFGLSASTTSKHLSILYQAGLLNSRKEGRWIHYSLPGGEASETVTQALGWLKTAMSDDPQALADRKRLEQILQTDPAELCKRQCRS